ncbi:MAG TPA: M23 family metallopeptidase [Candidatus Obscuribacterales bacterium]
MLFSHGLDSLARISAAICLGLLAYCTISAAMAGDSFAGSPTATASAARAFVSAPNSRGSSSVPGPAQRAAHMGETSIAGCSLYDKAGKILKPSSVVFVDNDIYCLDADRLWCAPNAVSSLRGKEQLRMVDCGPMTPMIGRIPMQEFLNFAYAPKRRSLVVLDKSGDVYEFSLADRAWYVLRPNSPMGSPDPEYLDMAVSGANICLLDPERNQIWRFPATSRKYFRDVLPWKVHSGDISVANGIGIAYDGNAWVLRAGGSISKFAADPEKGMATPLAFHWQALKKMRPSRFFTAPGAPLYIVERENNRVVAVDKQNGQWRQFLFPAESDLRALWVVADGFWIIDGSKLVHRDLTHADPSSAACHPRSIDTRLAGLVMPLPGAHLPRHPGVWAGSRRLYRFGVHHGTDFFDDPGNGTHVHMDSPIYAADSGKIIRADATFKDMDAAKYSYVIYQCHNKHISAEGDEDLLRGCQVWLDHGNGLITRYAHLDKIKPGLKPGMRISTGDLIGFVGVSGTGENLPGRAKHPHLHLEIYLDGKYLGYGLTPSETIGVYEDIFGNGPRG